MIRITKIVLCSKKMFKSSKFVRKMTKNSGLTSLCSLFKKLLIISKNITFENMFKISKILKNVWHFRKLQVYKFCSCFL